MVELPARAPTMRSIGSMWRIQSSTAFEPPASGAFANGRSRPQLIAPRARALATSRRCGCHRMRISACCPTRRRQVAKACGVSPVVKLPGYHQCGFVVPVSFHGHDCPEFPAGDDNRSLKRDRGSGHHYAVARNLPELPAMSS